MIDLKSKQAIRVYWIVGAAVLGLLVWMEARRTPQRRRTSEFGAQSQTDTQDAENRCAGLVKNALVMLRPESLGISSDTDTAVSLLNQWLRQCSGGLTRTKAAEEQERTSTRLLAPAALERLYGKEFQSYDGFHIRDCLWCKRAVDFAAGKTHRDLDRAVSLFYYVARNMHVADVGAPLTVFDAMLLGRGTAEHRAWVFAELLRQLRIDAVILRTASSEPAGGRDKLLVGVLIGSDVFLFDPRLGLPLPSPADGVGTLLPSRPATLAEARRDPALLRQLDAGPNAPYPWRTEDFEHLQVDLIGNTSLWSVRMQTFQHVLVGADTAVVFDGLDDSEFGPGLWSRVAEVGARQQPAWNEETIRVWPFPEQQLAGKIHMNSKERRAFRSLYESLTVPIPLTSVEQVEDDDGRPQLKLRFAPPQKLHLEKRTQQLLGDFAGAIQGYLLIRLWRDVPPTPKNVYVPREVAPILAARVPERVKRPHQQAAQEAFYRIAVCQYEQGEPGRARNTLRDFLNAFSDTPLSDPARLLMAVCQLEGGERAEAINTLKDIAEDSALYPTARYLIRRWAQAEKPNGSSAARKKWSPCSRCFASVGS